MNFLKKWTIPLLVCMVTVGITLPGMAHPGDTGNLKHDHPLTEVLPPVDLNGDGIFGDGLYTPGEELDGNDAWSAKTEALVPGEERIGPHNSHPTVKSIKVDGGGGNQTYIVVGDGDAANDGAGRKDFMLVVEFDQAVVSGPSIKEVGDTGDDGFTAANFTAVFLSADGKTGAGVLRYPDKGADGEDHPKKGEPVFGSAGSPDSPSYEVTRVMKDDKIVPTKFKIKVTPVSYPNGGNLKFRILIKDNLYSLQTSQFPAGSVQSVTVKGGRSLESVKDFTLIKSKPANTNLDGDQGKKPQTNIPSDQMLINEVGNLPGSLYDWIELRNASGGEKNLRNYMISLVDLKDDTAGMYQDTPLIQFPDNDSAKVPAGAVFLILASDPANDENHPIAATGYNVDLSDAQQQPGTPNSPVRYKVLSELHLPDDDTGFVLILRKPDGNGGERANAKDAGNKGVAETGNNDLDKIQDIAGWHPGLKANNYPNLNSNTGVWPLYGMGDIDKFEDNNFAVGFVHQRNRVTTTNIDGKIGGMSGVGAEKEKAGNTAFGDAGWLGVGYRRGVAATPMHGGTPGYPNSAAPGAGADITSAVYISEIMYVDGSKGTLPQWIELRNPSTTMGANLQNWRLTITNHADAVAFEDGAWAGKSQASVLLNDLRIKPNSAVLITTRKGPRSDVFLADSEIFTLFPTHKDAFGMNSANDNVLNTFGFKITLHANGHEDDTAKWELVDTAGNLATGMDERLGVDTERYNMPSWAWPMAMTEEEARISVARVPVWMKDADMNPVSARSDGTEMASWIRSDMDPRTDAIDAVYYGHKDDISTPGQTKGQPLPVSLSFFRPTLEDGAVVIRWTTESELDNAGFNILRSNTRDGEFTQVNAQLIPGHGTTAERNTYKWVDSSAKPGAVYYYQIEDVSFAGEQNVLTTTKLKGLISAKHKLTTTWSEIKEVN